MNDWLAHRANALAVASGVDRAALDLSNEDIDCLLELAGYAAHDSDMRTNAPLLCYLVGLARAGGTSLEELDGAVRSTS